jgi:hypothetical protein
MLDPSGYFALGATVYRRADFTCLAAEHVDFDTYLVLYRFRNQQTDREPACRQPYLESVALPATGFYVMRSGGGWASTRVDGPDYDETLYLFFDAAPAYGHTHYDALNIIVAGYGSKPPYNLLDESGAAHNWSINPLTHYYSRSRAHNVVVIDDQLTPSGVNDPPPTVHRWYTSASLDFVSGSYGGPYEGNMVTRNILFVKGEYWILRDEILGKGTHVLEQLFNFVPVVRRTEQGEVMRQADLTVNTARQSVVPNYDGPRLLLMPADPAQLGLELKEGWKWHPTFAALREDVGQFLDVRAPTVSYMKKVDTTVPTAFETILFPLHKGEEREIAVERLRVTDAGVGSAEASGLRIAIGASNLHNRTWSKRAAKVDYYVRSVRSIHVTFGETISLLGSYGLIRSHQEGEPFVMCILDGQELAYASYRVRLEKRGAACVEQDSDGGYVVEASDTVQLTLPTREQGPHARKRARYRRLNGPWTESLVAEESNEASLSLRVPGGGRFELLMQ